MKTQSKNCKTGVILTGLIEDSGLCELARLTQLPSHLYCLNSVAIFNAGKVCREENNVGDELHKLGVDRNGGPDACQQAIVARLGLGRFVHLRGQVCNKLLTRMAEGVDPSKND